MIYEFDRLHNRHSCDFACRVGEKTAGLFRIVSYHHKIVIELGKYRFDSFTEPISSMTKNSRCNQSLNREMFPLASRLEFVEYGVNYLNKTTFSFKSAFHRRKIWIYFRFYCNFVKYG